MLTDFMRDQTRPLAALLLALAGAPAAAEERPLVTDPGAPIARALEAASEDVRAYDQHITILASPFMEGRVPGSAGIERAAQYIEMHLAASGLKPAFPAEDGSWSFRQPFQAGSEINIKQEALEGFLPSGDRVTLTPDVDFNALGRSDDAFFTAPITFVGYAIDNGPDGYNSFEPDTSLRGQWAMIARFEPMDDQGNSLWTDQDWTAAAGLANKFRGVLERDAAGIILVTPEAANDHRVGELMDERSMSGPTITDIPVVHMTPEAADRLVRAGDARGRSFTELCRHADDGGAPVRLSTLLDTKIQLDREPVMTDNVGGMLPGRGELADEVLIVGAHYDHLGKGYFGSRSGPGELHVGADDNASGTAAVIMIADKLAGMYQALPEDADARTIVFQLYTAEESGLNGARYYVNNPSFPIDTHIAMINLDMIGRIKNDRLSVSGTGTAEGFIDILQPHFDDSGLEIVTPTAISGRSDHWPFYQAGMPVLFAIIADFHDDYHTPRDVSWKINRHGAVKTADMFAGIALDLATRDERLEFVEPSAAQQQAVRPMGRVKVRVGIAPGNYGGDGTPGILISDVYENTSAAAAGLKPGDRMTAWNGNPVPTVEDWMPYLTEHEPGDTVLVNIVRDGQTMAIEMTLKPRNAGG